MSTYAIKLHRDGSFTYWSVYRQQWAHRVRHMDEREFQALSERDRGRLVRHITRCVEREP